MFQPLLLSINFWIGVVAMLILMCIATLFFIVLDVLSSPRVSRVRIDRAPGFGATLTNAWRRSKRLRANLFGFTAVAGFWMLLAVTALAPQP